MLYPPGSDHPIRLLWARKSHRAESEYSEEYISEYDSMIRTGTPEFFMQESTPDSLTEKIRRIGHFGC